MNTLLTIVSTTFCILSIPFYMIVIGVLIAYRHTTGLKSSFFALSISLGFADLFEVTSQNLLQIFPKRGWFVEEIYLKYSTGYLPVFCDQFVWFGMIVQYIGLSLLTLNRLTAIVFPTKYEQIWRNRNVKIAIALQWIVPFAVYAPIPFLATGKYIRPINFAILQLEQCGNGSLAGSEVICWMNEESIRSAYLSLLLPADIITLIFNSAAYVIIIASLYSHKMRSTATKKNLGWSNFIVEIKLTIAAMIVFLILLGMVVFQLIMKYDECSSGIYFDYVYALMDLFALCNPYLLVAFSTPLREQLFAICRPQSINSYRDVSSSN